MLRTVVQSSAEVVSLDMVDAFEKGSGDISIGREGISLFPLNGLADREHALLRRRPACVTLMDLGSKSGT